MCLDGTSVSTHMARAQPPHSVWTYKDGRLHCHVSVSVLKRTNSGVYQDNVTTGLQHSNNTRTVRCNVGFNNQLPGVLSKLAHNNITMPSKEIAEGAIKRAVETATVIIVGTHIF